MIFAPLDFFKGVFQPPLWKPRDGHAQLTEIRRENKTTQEKKRNPFDILNLFLVLGLVVNFSSPTLKSVLFFQRFNLSLKSNARKEEEEEEGDERKS